jgi:gliding motility-associated-like protein
VWPWLLGIVIVAAVIVVWCFDLHDSFRCNGIEQSIRAETINNVSKDYQNEVKYGDESKTESKSMDGNGHEGNEQLKNICAGKMKEETAFPTSDTVDNTIITESKKLINKGNLVTPLKNNDNNYQITIQQNASQLPVDETLVETKQKTKETDKTANYQNNTNERYAQTTVAGSQIDITVDSFAYHYNQADINASSSYVEENCLVEPEKFFTPNNDGLNDYWIIKGSDCGVDMVEIYDRSGKLLVREERFVYWDGTFDNKRMLPGDYWYLITLKNGKKLTGHFALIR